MTERYTILRELGHGAIGTVYAARDGSTGALVALKTLNPALFQQSKPELAELFLKNARSATTLRHRNIVRTFDAGEAGGTAYVAMELVEGESLRKMLDERPLPIARAIQIFDDIASALAYAHEEKVVHRGVRPSSILVSASGVAKLGDFGVGQIGEAARRYMSPEQTRREAVDHRSDLFSLGAVFYEMLTQRSPFEADSPPPSKVNPHVPGALDALVSRLLAPRPDDRFANARDLLRELQRLEEALGIRPTASVPAEPIATTAIVRAEPSVRTPDPEPMHDREPSAAEDWEPRIRIPEDRGPRPQPSAGSRIASSLAALALVLAVVSIGLTVLLHYSPDLIEKFPLASRTQEAPTAAPVAAPIPPSAPPATEAIKEPVKPEEPASVAGAPQAVPPVPLPAEPAPLAQTEPLAIKTAHVLESQPATLILAVAPRGEVYIDGEHHGATPPLKALDLEPGMHRIEIRNGSRKPFVTYVTLNAGDERRIRHDFSVKPSGPRR
jgi:eukaryotic-like serine/threonine-protein kinase